VLKSEPVLTPAQGAASRLIVHFRPAGPGYLAASVAGDRIVIRYDRRRPNAPGVWEGFRVDCLPRAEHPDHGWEAFLAGRPGDLPVWPDEVRVRPDRGYR